jgi:glucans biosynthesis protein
MHIPITRRDVLGGALNLSLLALASGLPFKDALAAESGLSFGPPEPFDFEKLKSSARALAAASFRLPDVPHADKLEAIDYDAYQKIANRPGAELWAEASDSTYPIQPFHLHRYAQESVRLFRVENGTAREFLFDPSLFN